VVSALHVVAARRPAPARAALAAGRIIAVPGDGGYVLAVRWQRPGALGALGAFRALPPASLVEDPADVVVGRRAEAIEIASAWSNYTRLLTDRMWPGPLTVMVLTRHEAFTSNGSESKVQISMPASRVLRRLCRESGPLIVLPLGRSDGSPLVAFDEVRARFTENELALGIDGGTCEGAGSTVVDCTVSPPAVRRVGEIPESYVDAAMMMETVRRRWFSARRTAKPSLEG
jgi:L-threonylcarbamoyladenylate synthase